MRIGRHFLIRNNNLYAIKRKNEYLNEDFTYTTSGNDITLQLYTGSNTDVSLVDKSEDYFCLARPLPPIYGVNVDDYTYTYLGNILTLTRYVGSNSDIDTPEIEEVPE